MNRTEAEAQPKSDMIIKMIIVFKETRMYFILQKPGSVDEEVREFSLA